MKSEQIISELEQFRSSVKGLLDGLPWEQLRSLLAEISPVQAAPVEVVRVGLKNLLPPTSEFIENLERAWLEHREALGDPDPETG